MGVTHLFDSYGSGVPQITNTEYCPRFFYVCMVEVLLGAKKIEKFCEAIENKRAKNKFLIIVRLRSGRKAIKRMKTIIVSCLSVCLDIVFVAVIVAGSVIGYHICYRLGGSGNNGELGIIFGALAGFVVDMIVLGPICILLDMWENQKRICANIEKLVSKK
ncbi:hypothetical protein AGMMS4957_04060 [Bacteroidia bacterium]|nr:hypothetical protein AGMMS4957_04060 [Bacteroidia bacterium]